MSPDAYSDTRASGRNARASWQAKSGKAQIARRRTSFVADVERWLAARAASQPNGFLDPVVVIDLNLRYVRTVYGEGRPSVSWGEVYIPHVTDWFALGSEGLESAT